MLCKKLACILSLTAAFAFVACDDESSPTFTKGGDDETQLSSDSKDNDKSSESKGAESTDSNGDEVSSSSIGGKIDIDINDLKCDEEGATKTETYMGQEMPFVCEAGYWVLDEDSYEEMMSCDEEGARDTLEVMGMKVINVCVDGEWEVDSAATSKCDKEGDEMEIDMGGIVMKATCVDGTWVPDEEAMDDQFKCTEAEEGTTKEIFGMPMVCKDGEWEFDMGDIDIGWGVDTLVTED